MHDGGSNCKSACIAIAREGQEKGKPVFEELYCLHELHTYTGKSVERIAKLKEASAFCGRVASCLKHHRRVRDRFADLMKDRTKESTATVGDTQVRRTVSDTAAPPLLGQTKCLCKPNNILRVHEL